MHPRLSSSGLARAALPYACRAARRVTSRVFTSCAAASKTMVGPPFLPNTCCSRNGPPKPIFNALGSRRSYAGCGCRGAKSSTTAYIALGGNLGDRVAEIERACKEMDKRGIKVTRTSSLWETEPMYVTDQDRFLNGVCEVRLSLSTHLKPPLQKAARAKSTIPASLRSMSISDGLNFLDRDRSRANGSPGPTSVD